MTEETFKSMDEAFQGVKDDQLEEPKIGEVAEVVKVEEEIPAKTEEIPAKETEDLQPPETGEKTDWEALGFPEFSGKSEVEIAAVLNQKKTETGYRDVLYGQQANEVGTLRKQVEELEGQLKKSPAPEKVDSLSEKDVADFQEMLAIDPMGALDKYYGPTMEKMVQGKLEDAMTSTDGPISRKLAEQLDVIERQQLYARHPDVDDYVSEMTALDEPKALGNQHRPYEEMYQLGKLWKGKDPMWEATYQLMAKYPQMAFSDANAIATAQKVDKSDSEAEKGKVLDQVGKIKQATPKKTTTTQTEKAKVYSTVDEAFESIPDD